MTRPRLLDLFCGAGGAAMGYHRAGFDVHAFTLDTGSHKA
jgi:site-specific DNA-cytosine methylase